MKRIRISFMLHSSVFGMLRESAKRLNLPLTETARFLLITGIVKEYSIDRDLKIKKGGKK